MVVKRRVRKQKPKLPGHVRCTLQLYVAGRRFYGQIPGKSLSAIRVSTPEELEALWKQLQSVIDQADWRRGHAPVDALTAAGIV